MKVIVSLFLTLFLVEGFGQGEIYSSGSAQAGGAFSDITSTNPYAVFNNIAGINQGIKGTHLLNGYSLLYEGTGISKVYAGLVTKIKNAGAGISFTRSGEKDFGETIIGLGAANRIRNVSLGVKFNCYQLAVSESKTIIRPILQFGGIAELSKHFLFGAHIFNLNQAQFNQEWKFFIPVIMSAGVTWKPLENLRINLLTEKNSNYDPQIRTGVEYLIERKLYLRTGFSTNPSSCYFGCGFQNKRYQIDYALRTHPQLGNSHHFSLAINLSKKV